MTTPDTPINNTPGTGEIVARLRELMAKATLAPWTHGGQSRKSIGYYGPNGPDADWHRWRNVAKTEEFEDGDFISEMRNALPALLDAVDLPVAAGEPDFGRVHCNVSDPLEGRDWSAVDFDGTLAHYEGFKGPTVLGEPIPAMVEQVRGWLRIGRKVCIYTARISGAADGRDPQEVKAAVKAWCLENIGRELPVTCIKGHGIDAFYDDRAFQVEKNTGRIVIDLHAELAAVRAELARSKACAAEMFDACKADQRSYVAATKRAEEERDALRVEVAQTKTQLAAAKRSAQRTVNEWDEDTEDIERQHNVIARRNKVERDKLQIQLDSARLAVDKAVALLEEVHEFDKFMPSDFYLVLARIDAFLAAREGGK